LDSSSEALPPGIGSNVELFDFFHRKLLNGDLERERPPTFPSEEPFVSKKRVEEETNKKKDETKQTKTQTDAYIHLSIIS